MPPPPAANRAPVVIRAIPDQRASIGQPFRIEYFAGGPVFADPDGEPVTLQSINLGGDAVGLSTSSADHLSGTPDRRGRMLVTLRAADPHGAIAEMTFAIVVDNAAPVAARPMPAAMVAPGQRVSVDVTRGGTTFTDADGHALSYEITLVGIDRGLRVEGTTVTGVLAAPGTTQVDVVARDGHGGSAADSFMIAALAPEPGVPHLPSVPYSYDDAQQPWPEVYRQSRANRGPLWDTTPFDNPTTDAGAALGRVLFYDRRLSIDRTLACASCHKQAHAFSSGERFSTGVLGLPTSRHAMNLSSVRYNIEDRYFSDARVTTLERLALEPIETTVELGFEVPLLVERLRATEFYPPLFAAAFGTPEITPDRIARSLAQFMRALVSYRSKFDLVTFPLQLGGPPRAAFTADEQRGEELFRIAGCHHCHQHDAHVATRLANNGLDAVARDPGAGGGAFRSAGLRNVAVSGPYMHDGRFATLREVIDHYDSGVQFSPTLSFLLRTRSNPSAPDLDAPLRLNLSESDKRALEAFLHTLTDPSFLQDPRLADPFTP
jgi:cytochrome c peroxidase